MSEEKYLGRIVKQKVTFIAEGAYESFYLARLWCKENGYEEGSMCGDMPIALMKGEYNLPWKWKNMYTEERNSVDGVMVSSSFREDQVDIYIFN